MATPAPSRTAEAMDMVLTGLSYLAAADPTALAARAQAECLQAFEQADAISTAARAWFLAAFTTGQGYADDADYSPAAWLIHQTRVTKGAARGHLGWARRVQAHPQVAAALAQGTVLTESLARPIRGWTDKLPRDCRPAADDILLAPSLVFFFLMIGCPPRSTPGPCPTARTTKGRPSRTGKSASRPPSRAPESSLAT